MTELHFFITEQDIQRYAAISGDHNPIHLDEEQAISHGLSGKISHGMLTMAKVWRIISNNLLTSTDYPSGYELDFHAPIHVGDSVNLQVERARDRLIVEGFCKGKMVIKANITVA